MSVKIVQDPPVYLADDFTQLNKKVVNETDILIENKETNSVVQKDSLKEVNINKKAELFLSENVEKDTELLKNSAKLLEAESNIVSDAMQTISEFINMPLRTVNFTQDDGSEKTVIKIFDSESNELIKQFPSEEILMIAQRIVELQQDISQKTGILLDESI